MAAYPHDPSAFTQGLVVHGGFLYESTGGYGYSTVRKVDIESGRVLASRRLPRSLFGEGLTFLDGRLYQLTWRSGRVLVYEPDTLAPRGEHHIRTEGWGITHDGRRLIVSDGSDVLYFYAPDSFELIGRVPVRDGVLAVSRLNELEFLNGRILANVWESDNIAVISPDTGAITAWVDLAGLLPLPYRTARVDVLNGIAHDIEGDRLFVTGKRWPRLFHIELVERIRSGLAREPVSVIRSSGGITPKRNATEGSRR